MHIETLVTNNKWQHFHYLVVCEATREALAIDPFEAELVLATARENGWKITHIINTHEHPDHINGNAAVVDATGAKVMAHYDAQIPNVDIKLHPDQVIVIGGEVQLTVLDTPGHTMSHVCLFGYENDDDTKPFVFTGDTLFQAGAGNCYHGGDPEALYHTFEEQLNKLPDTTIVYPGHDYLANNLAFSLSVEPSNPHALLMQEALEEGRIKLPHFTSLRAEKLINPFFRCDSPEIEHSLRTLGYHLPAVQVRRIDIFLALRELRNKWQMSK